MVVAVVVVMCAITVLSEDHRYSEVDKYDNSRTWREMRSDLKRPRPMFSAVGIAHRLCSTGIMLCFCHNLTQMPEIHILVLLSRTAG